MTDTEEKPRETADPAPADSGDSRPSPGAMIRRARERAHMNLDELAGLTKLARPTLDALERDDYAALLEPVYVRGYYRKCAKVLDVPEKEMLDAYQAKVEPRAPSAPSKLRLASGTELGSASRLPIALAIAAALVAVVICAFVWFARSQVDTVPRSVSERASAPPAATAPEGDALQDGSGTQSDVTPGVGTPIPDREGDAPGGEVGAGLSASSAPGPGPGATTGTGSPPPAPVAGPGVTAAPAVVAPAPVPAAPAATGTSGQVTLSFSAASWVRVDDATGRTLVNELATVGETRNYGGTAPLSVFLGNAPGVKVEFDGQALDLKRFTRDNNTARFTLPPSPR